MEVTELLMELSEIIFLLKIITVMVIAIFIWHLIGKAWYALLDRLYNKLIKK